MVNQQSDVSDLFATVFLCQSKFLFEPSYLDQSKAFQRCPNLCRVGSNVGTMFISHAS